MRLVLLEPPGPDDAAAVIDSCPLDAESCLETGGTSSAGCYTLFYPERQPDALLHWFAETLDCPARLEFPAALSKHERARWHEAAQRCRLHTESVGIGAERYLTVSNRGPAAAAGLAPLDDAAGGQQQPRRGPRLTRKQEQRARAVYDCLQMEGQFWEYSRGEVEAMVASGAALPAAVQDVVERRCVWGGEGM